ncbi:MAG: DUF3467 domain-containing protein [Anaerolineales bacterium]|nr:DUF3467 domain-containing protein [Anaerolineales bacterium]
MSDQPASAPQSTPQKINIDVPRDTKAEFSNLAIIRHTPAEVVFDFVHVLPQTTRGTVQARVVMTPMHAKMLQLALAQNIQNYERQFGEIRIPNRASPLVDNFFRFSSSGDDKDQGE